MTALAKPRNTLRLGTLGDVRSKENYPVKASTIIYAGALVALDASGNAEGGVTATGLTAVGRADNTYDNSAGIAGAITANVQPGVFKFNNSASTDAITAAHIDTLCYIVDDNTVAHTDGSASRSVAGVVNKVDTDGVWVSVGMTVAG